MISRYHLRCPGCEEMFVARLGVEPTRGTRFYLPCPLCRLPIRGSMSGSELSNHRIAIDCEVLSGDDPEPDGVPVVTINPFVPSLYEADSLAPTGAFPTMTLVQILGDDVFVEFGSVRHQALEAGRTLWPQVRMLFQYYLQGNAEMFTRIAKQHFGLEWEPSTSHERTSVAYQALGIAQVPGWESFAVLLDNRRRNTIGHATAHHELQTGRAVSDEDPAGMTYLEFLSETLGVFEALSTLAQVLRASRVAASPDFGLEE